MIAPSLDDAGRSAAEDDGPPEGCVSEEAGRRSGTLGKRPRVKQTPSAPLPARTTVNFLLDAALLLIFLTIAWLSVVLRFVFPAGAAARGWTLWGATYDDLCGLQFVVICLFALTVLVHVMLHWSWVCGVLAKGASRWLGRMVRLDEGARTLYGVGLLILLLNLMGACVAAAALSIQGPMH